MPKTIVSLILSLASVFGWAQETVRWLPWPKASAPLVRQAPARAVAAEEIELAPAISGRLIALWGRAGEIVAGGQLLAQLEETPLRAAYEQASAQVAAAQAHLSQAERHLAQAQALRPKQLISAEALTQAQEALTLARQELAARQAALADAKWRLEQCQVRAPWPGRVSARLASVGQWIAAGQPLLRLTSAEFELHAQISAAELETVHTSQVRFTAASGESCQLTWLGTSPRRLETTQQALVRFRCVDPPATLTAGAVGTVVWKSRLRVAPPAAVTTWRGQVGVWIKDAARAKPRFLALKHALPGRAVALELPAQAWLAVAGHGALGWAP